MVTRIMLSLKKAAASQGDQWSLGGSTTLTGVVFAGNQNRDATGDGIALETLRSKGRGGGLRLGAMS